MRLLLNIYSLYGLVVFALTFLLLLPFFLLAIFFQPFERMAATLNHIWAKIFFFLMFLNRTEVVFEEPLDKEQTYVFCANHFSYLDIPTIGLIHHNFKFIGKSSLRKVPLWGYMYRKLHILVNRESLKSSYGSLLQAQNAIQSGFSMVFFPEGGIKSKNPPRMAPFKEGSFRLAVEQNIPLVPITIAFNHIRLPDKYPLTMYPGKIKIIVHKPITPAEGREESIRALKDRTKALIQHELDKINNTKA